MSDLMKKIFSSRHKVPNFDDWVTVEEPPSYQPFGAPVLKASVRYRHFVRKNGSPNRVEMRTVLIAEYDFLRSICAESTPKPESTNSQK